MDKLHTKLSKEMSYALRHSPQSFGIVLDSEGYTAIDGLLSAIGRKSGIAPTLSDIEYIMEHSEKKRFEIKGDRIRATYGHSVKGKIEFEESMPPDVLYHGTSRRVLHSIREYGVLPMERQYVHLSSDMATARKVAERHDKKPVILVVDAKSMHNDGYKFFHSANDGTWMCEKVPFKYIIATAFNW